jgi:hypothetical protein
MATLNPDFVNLMSAYSADFSFNGVDYKTLWSKVRGPVDKMRDYRNDLILVDMWKVDTFGMPNVCTGAIDEVEVGSAPWAAALESITNEDLYRLRIGELGAFRFGDDYQAEYSWYGAVDQLHFYLSMLDHDVDPEFGEESNLMLNPKFHKRLIKLLSDYEYHREKELKQSIFFYHWSRDCDLCESEGTEVFSDWYRAAEWIQGFGESAEGPQSLYQMTYEQWRVFNAAPVRDRALEQFEEYGYGH